MILDTLMSVFSAKNSSTNKQKTNLDRKKFINQKYQERSITNRYFK